MSLPSTRARTGLMRMIARVSVTSSGSFMSLRWIVSLTDEWSGPRSLSAAWLRVRPCTASPSIRVIRVAGQDARSGSGRLVHGSDDLQESPLDSGLDADATERAVG